MGHLPGIRRWGRAATVVALLALGQGCGYRFAVGESGIPDSVGPIYVPVFSNRSTDAEAGALFAEALAERLARNGRLAAAGAPAVIDGEVVSITWEPAATGPDGTGVGVYRLRARLTLSLRHQGQIVCIREISGGEDFLPARDLLNLEASRRLAVRRLAETLMAEVEQGFCPTI